MLFDLRSRGRRTTVRAVYLALAVLMGGGLILFGVGTGVGGGGLLNAFNGGSSNQGAVVSSAEKKAVRATRLRPQDPAAWASLIQERWTTVGQNGNFNASTGSLTASGRREATLLTQDWLRYLQLTGGKDPAGVALIAAHDYAKLADYSGAASAWEVQTAANPGAPSAYECLAASAYAAKQTRKGDLALAKALTMVPKLQRALLKQQIQQAKTQPQLAQTC